MTREEMSNIRMGELSKYTSKQISFYLGISLESFRGYLQGRCKVPKDIAATLVSLAEEEEE